MRTIDDNPLIQAGVLLVLYVAGTGAMMFAKELIAPAEVPWTWLWMFWGILFAPAFVVTIFAAMWIGPSWSRLKRLYGASLLTTLVVMQLTLLAAPHLGIAMLVVCGTCAAIVIIFKTFKGAPDDSKG